MSWTQERVSSALSRLDTPTTNEDFWERVGSDLLVREPDLEAATSLALPQGPPMAEVGPFVRSGQRSRGYLVMGAAAAVLLAGLYLIGRPPDRTPEESPTHSEIVLTDPLSLSLDDMPRTAAPRVPQSEFVVPDVTEVLPGWTVTEESAFGILLPPDNGYRAIYSLVSPTGASYSIDVRAGLSMKPDRGSAVDINGHAGLQVTSEVWWEQQPGIEVTVSHALGAASPVAIPELIDAARGVVFTTVKELPIVPIDPATEPVRVGAQFAGTLSGIRYTVAANSGPLRGIFVSVGDQGVGGVADDRSSQPTNDPQTAGSVNITGVTGYGVIVFGYTEPATAALRANLANGDAIQVPVLRNPGETYFALPIPLGVEVITLDFLNDTRETLRTATMPILPAYFGHCCAMAPWTTELAPATPTSGTTP